MAKKIPYSLLHIILGTNVILELFSQTQNRLYMLNINTYARLEFHCKVVVKHGDSCQLFIPDDAVRKVMQ